MSKLQRIRGDIGQVLTPDFLAGGSVPDFRNLIEPIQDEWDEDVMRGLLDHAVALDFEVHKELDAWLAPRLHFVLRLSRRTASDWRMWTWLAVTVGRDYVVHRWADGGRVNPMRYHGELLRNALSRLWWGAELVRNGASYREVPVVFKDVRTAQFALELKYSWYRPAAIAFARVAEGLDGGDPLTDDEKKNLSRTINAYLSLTALEARGYDDDDSDDVEWRRRQPPLATALQEDIRTLEGPSGGAASEEAIRELERWFRQVVGEIATVSGR